MTESGTLESPPDVSCSFKAVGLPARRDGSLHAKPGDTVEFLLTVTNDSTTEQPQLLLAVGGNTSYEDPTDFTVNGEKREELAPGTFGAGNRVNYGIPYTNGAPLAPGETITIRFSRRISTTPKERAICHVGVRSINTSVLTRILVQSVIDTHYAGLDLALTGPGTAAAGEQAALRLDITNTDSLNTDNDHTEGQSLRVVVFADSRITGVSGEIPNEGTKTEVKRAALRKLKVPGAWSSTAGLKKLAVGATHSVDITLTVTTEPSLLADTSPAIIEVWIGNFDKVGVWELLGSKATRDGLVKMQQANPEQFWSTQYQLAVPAPSSVQDVPQP
ncbi:hypothetical protein ABZX93_27415 [Streptomyces sp. NPDC006632]|uniref:hypothetical protein n=1 Tax=Streptomyces sp. NPDC006632 TaxID=3157182 RepID=UPI0033BE7C18